MSVIDWMWQIALKKAAQNWIKTFLAIYGVKLAAFATNYGITITFNEQVLMSSVVALFEFARNWLKFKRGFVWL